jgi:putative hydrolase of the HAD superfamily
MLGHFDCIRCRDHSGTAKPNPKVYQQVLEALNIGADEAIAFEDSPNGILAARGAGIYAVAVPNLMTCNLVFEGANERIERLSVEKLDELLARLGSKE